MRKDGYYWVKYLGKMYIGEWSNNSTHSSGQGTFKLFIKGTYFEHDFDFIDENPIVYGK